MKERNMGNQKTLIIQSIKLITRGPTKLYTWILNDNLTTKEMKKKKNVLHK